MKNKFDTVEKVEKFLNTIPQFVEKTGVERCRLLLKELGSPQDKLKVIHVAGTNGKGSVCSYINEILIHNGYKTGFFTSPHLVDIRERIRLCNDMVSKDTFIRYFNRVYEAALRLKKDNTDIAYFDYFLAIAMCIYSDENVDYVVMETGLGGKLDATNAIAHPVLSVITTISLEHTAILGDTLEKIATEKAGIIKKGVPVVFLAKKDETTAVFINKAKEAGTVYTAVMPKDYKIRENKANYIDFLVNNEYYKNDCFVIDSKAIYQVENCTLALTAAAVMQRYNIAHIDIQCSRKAVREAHWEGRIEEVLPDVYVDGAHNPEGIDAFISSVKGMCQGKSCMLLFSVVRDKNFEQMISKLCACGLFDEYVITQVGGARQLDDKSMKDVFMKYTGKKITEHVSVRDAFDYALKNKKHLLVCAGSLYLTGEIKSIISSYTAE